MLVYMKKGGSIRHQHEKGGYVEFRVDRYYDVPEEQAKKWLADGTAREVKLAPNGEILGYLDAVAPGAPPSLVPAAPREPKKMPQPDPKRVKAEPKRATASAKSGGE